MSSDPVRAYGFTPVPRNLDKLLEKADPHANPPEKHMVDEILPSFTDLSKEVQSYAKKELPEETYNHSMRVLCFGLAIHAQYLPHIPLPSGAYILACLLHDLGTAPQHMNSTHLSFEYRGAILAHNLILSLTPPPAEPITPNPHPALAESVAEAIIRHQDIDEVGKGNLSIVTAVLQIATVLDNTGARIELIDKRFVEEVCERFSRTSGKGEEKRTWSGCFAVVVEKELREKRWSHTTKLGQEFAQGVRGNWAFSGKGLE
ncbi:MAG: hypothetical protein Q9217_005200 [Psora testacea]